MKFDKINWLVSVSLVFMIAISLSNSSKISVRNQLVSDSTTGLTGKNGAPEPAKSVTANILKNAANKKSISAIAKAKVTLKNPNKNVKPKEYSLAVFGDIGEFEIYKKNKKSLIKELLDDKPNYKAVCDPFILKNKDNMMVNFRRVLKALKPEHITDDVVVLGDMVYPEQKKLGKALNAIRDEAAKKAEDKSIDEADRNEWKKFKNIKSASQLAPNDQELGKAIDERIETKSSSINENKEIQNIKEKDMRLNCGWRYLKSTVQDKNITPAWIGDKIQFIFGNHSYDVDYMFEARFISKYFSNRMFLRLPDKDNNVPAKFTHRELDPSEFIKPRIVSANTKLFRIEYIDVDPSLLTCSEFLVGFADYKDMKAKNKVGDFQKCQKGRMGDVNFPGLERTDTEGTINIFINYYKQLLATLAAVDKKADWRLVRMHQPIFNVEFDYAGMKLNKQLMESFKKAHIHAYLVSHFHSAQFTVSLFERNNYKHHNVSKFNPNALSLKRPEELKKSFKEYPNPWTSTDDFIFDADKNNALRWNDQIVTLVDRSQAYLKRNSKVAKVNVVEVSNNNEEFILQILTGHSGRTLDPLYNDMFSDLALIFGTSKYKGNGFTRIRFYLDEGSQKCLEATYLILNSEGVLENKFTIVIRQKEDFAETNREKIFTHLYGINFNDDLLLTHLKKSVDPFA